MFLNNNTLRYFRNNEKGRTMVEMFSVVIIVSILTAIGIRGYTYARDRYYANKITQAVLQEGAQLLANRKLRSLANDSPISAQTYMDRSLPTGAGHTITKTGTNVYEINITGLSVRVCEMVVEIRATRMTTNGNDCDTTGTAVFTFSNE